MSLQSIGCVVLILASAGVATAAPERPNLLLLVSDDQRWDALGCAGNRIIQTCPSAEPHS